MSLVDKMDTNINEKPLDERLAMLEKTRAWSPRTISKLEGLIRTGDDFSLFRINPIKFSTEKNIPENEAIDLFLFGSKYLLFDMNWNLICPGCSDIVSSFRTLKTLHSHFYCNVCHVSTEASLDDYIQIAFTISPEIREIAFHHPESLSVEDYYFKYRFYSDAKYPNGLRFADVVSQVMKCLSYISPKGKECFDIEVAAGFLSGGDIMNGADVVFEINGEIKPEKQNLSLKLMDGKFEPRSGVLSPGKVTLEIENTMDRKGSILLTNLPAGGGVGVLNIGNFLSGKRILTSQTFRDLYRTEVIQGTEGIGVKDIAVLFTDLKGSTALYDKIGDLKAFSLVRQHFDSLGKVVVKNSGAIVKTIGDAVMATFMNPFDAVNSAIEMLKEIEEFNRGLKGKEIILKIGVHKGPSIAVTLNDRLDYFGSTVNIASRVQELADAEEIYITEDVYSYPRVQELLRGLNAAPENARLKGIHEEMKVYKITR